MHYLIVPLPSVEQGTYRPYVGTLGRFSYFIFLIADLMKHEIVDVKENPYNIPEIIRLLLLDSYFVKYCIVPSMANGTINMAILLWKV